MVLLVISSPVIRRIELEAVSSIIDHPIIIPFLAYIPHPRFQASTSSDPPFRIGKSELKVELRSIIINFMAKHRYRPSMSDGSSNSICCCIWFIALGLSAYIILFRRISLSSFLAYTYGLSFQVPPSTRTSARSARMPFELDNCSQGAGAAYYYAVQLD
jgi:hypothetical protein